MQLCMFSYSLVFILFTYGLKKKDTIVVMVASDVGVSLVVPMSLESRSNKNHDRPTNKDHGKLIV